MFSFFYWFVAFCFISINPAFTYIGFTITNLFPSYLGSERKNFIYFHMKRISMTIFIHSSVPMIFYLLILLLGEKGLNSIEDSSLLTETYFWDLYFIFSTTVLALGATTFYYWTTNNFINNPIRVAISRYHDNFDIASSAIQRDFLALNSFIEPIGTFKTIVLPDWLLKTAVYDVTIAHLDHVTIKQLSVESSLSREGAMRLVRINIFPSNHHHFQIIISARSYPDFKEFLRVPIQEDQEPRTDSQLFIEELQQHVVNSNHRYRSPSNHQEQQACIGCYDNPPEVKLWKRCDSEGCGTCRCPPMWCFRCMGEWFVSRQDSNTPHLWFRGISPCPLCRARFCVHDIALLDDVI